MFAKSSLLGLVPLCEDDDHLHLNALGREGLTSKTKSKAQGSCACVKVPEQTSISRKNASMQSFEMLKMAPFSWYREPPRRKLVSGEDHLQAYRSSSSTEGQSVWLPNQSLKESLLCRRDFHLANVNRNGLARFSARLAGSHTSRIDGIDALRLEHHLTCILRSGSDPTQYFQTDIPMIYLVFFLCALNVVAFERRR